MGNNLPKKDNLHQVVRNRTTWCYFSLIPHITPVKPLCTGRLKHVRDVAEPSPKGHMTLTFFKPIPHFFLFQKPPNLRLQATVQDCVSLSCHSVPVTLWRLHIGLWGVIGYKYRQFLICTRIVGCLTDQSPWYLTGRVMVRKVSPPLARKWWGFLSNTSQGARHGVSVNSDSFFSFFVQNEFDFNMSSRSHS